MGALSVAVLAHMGTLGSLSDTLTGSASTAALNTGTFGDRQSGWSDLISGQLHGGPVAVLFGFPFGSGFQRVVNGVSEAYGPHSQFVLTSLRMGLVGVSLLFLLILRATRKGPDRALRLGLLATVIAYGMAYQWDYPQAVMLAVLLVVWPSDSAADSERAEPDAGLLPLQAHERSGRKR